MDFSKLISSDIQNYINQNLNSDLNKLLLKKSPFSDVTMQEIVQQIKGRKTAEKKFPFRHELILGVMIYSILIRF